MSIEPVEFRQAMSRFTTGVTVVTTVSAGKRYGITVNAFASVSLDPPLILICIDRSSRVHDVLIERGFFAVNFLSKEQRDLAIGFARNSVERYELFCGATSSIAVTGAPIIEDTIGFVDCTIADVYPGGDHSIIVGRVQALEHRDGDPLIYFRSHYLDAVNTDPVNIRP
jgi:flavin reductase (DIM6/NTAB) family NADH-FMN oxidoreductase RutF